MKDLFILYENDNFHSLKTSIVIGVFTSKNKLLKAVKKEIKRIGENKENIKFQYNYFIDNLQTQGLSNVDLRAVKIEPNKIDN